MPLIRHLSFGAATPPPVNASGYNNTSVTIPYTVADATSGVESPSSGGTLTFSTQGANQTQSVTITDNAGNSQTFTSPAVSVESHASGYDCRKWRCRGWHRGSCSPATDNLSGVVSTTYQVDNGTLTTYVAPFTVTGVGAHTVTYHSVDVASNVETIKTDQLTNGLPTTPVTTATLQPIHTKWRQWLVYGASYQSRSPQAMLGDRDWRARHTQSTADRVKHIMRHLLLARDGAHTITYFSTDKLNAVEPTQSLCPSNSTPRIPPSRSALRRRRRSTAVATTTLR